MKRNRFVRKRFLIIIIALALSATGVLLALPQPAKALNDPTGRGVGFTTVLYDNTNGLATSDANAIVQTEEGFIWIGSYSGLLRYDGNTFYRYDSSTGISSVVSLYADSKGRLWIGTNDNGIFVMEDGEFSSYSREDGLRSSSIRSIIEDNNGNILFATTLGMVYVDPEGVLHEIDDPWINGEYICELEPGADGVIYGLTNSGSFFSIDDLKVSAFYDYEKLGFGQINTIYPDPDNKGYIYLGMQNARVIYGNLAEGLLNSVEFSVEPQQNVACIRKLEDQLWICADNGIGYLGENGYVALDHLPMNNSVEHLMMDFEGKLWFTSSRQGLLKIVANRFIDISELSGLPAMVVNSTWVKDSLLYLGTDDGLRIIDSNYEQVENDLTELLEGVRIRTVREDSKGLLWFGTNSDYGLLCVDTETGEWKSYNMDNGLASNRARTFLELSDGSLAVATNAGVNILSDGKITGLYDTRQGLRNLEILCLEEGDNGRIYAGSDGDGIYVIDGENVKRLGVEDGLSSDVILRIHRDPFDKDVYWIITSNAINYLRGDEIHILRKFPYSNNFDLFFDADGHMWILSSNGLYAVNREHLLADQDISYTLYDINSGLPSAPTANSYSCLTEDGNLYIAAATGVCSLNIHEDADVSDKVKLAVPFIMADDTYIFVKGDEVSIPSDCKRLTIYAYAFSYSLNNPSLAIQLQGFDDNPISVSKHDMAPLAYTNLPGGNYNFHFATINTMTGQETQTLNLKISKAKRLTENIWFWILIAVVAAFLIAGSIFLYYRKKTKTLMKQQEEKEKLIDEMANVFARCIDMKDTYTNGHSRRVAKYTTMLAKRLNKYSDEELRKIHRIALLHDIGKISIPDRVLNKPGRLDDEEFAIMKTHSPRGADILKDVSLEPDLALGAGYHHERLDGRGYPNGLSGDDIPEIAQIIAVADTFDAMYSTRPYRKKMELSDIAAEIKRVSGTQLNPEVAQAMLDMIDEGVFDDESQRYDSE